MDDGPGAGTPDAGWQLVAHERAALVMDLRTLSRQDWHAPSLCDGLTVRDVVAHLTAGASLSFGPWLWGLVRNGLSTDRQVLWQLRRHLGRDAADTLRRFEQVVDSRVAPTKDVDAWLGEVVVHGEDIRRPLGLAHTHDPVALRRVATFYAGNDFTVPSRRRVRSVRLVATDVWFRHGAGPQVRGALVDLVLAMAGRPSALDRLDGPGVAVVRRTM